MSVYDLLTEEDKEKIIKYVDCYAPLMNNSSIPSEGDLPVILNEWDKEKSKNLIKLLDGQLIINRPYTYTTTDDALVREIEETLEEENCSIYYEFKQWVRWTLCDVDNGYPAEAISFGYELFDPHCLGVNAYEGESKKIIFSDGTFWKIQKGMKPMKILAKIVERSGDEEGKKLFEKFRIWHSMLLNQIHLDGTLSLSIHPLDFMTMSDNGGSWTSCMRWMGEGSDEGEPGDYRMGTVECMNSPYIVIAYLHNPKKSFEFWHSWHHDESMTWNKKKWRELFIVQNGIISEVKGYPYQDENLTNTALMWLKELAQKNLGWEYDDVEVNAASEYAPSDDATYMFKFRTGNYMYNDFGSLTLHRARVNLRDLHKRIENEELDINITEYTPRGRTTPHIIYDFNYGGKSTCMCCGSYIPYTENRSNSVLCLSCEPSHVCPCCGEYFEGDGYYVAAYADPICDNCIEYECDRDDLTEDYEYASSMIELSFYLGDDRNGNPVFYDNTIRTLDPEEYVNWGYQQTFTELPKYTRPKYSWGSGRAYITYNMIKDMKLFNEVFDINETYDELLVDYGILPDPDEETENLAD